MSRLSKSLACYAVLAVLTWFTITDPKLRGGTLLILALFTMKSILRRNDVLHSDKAGDPE